MSDLASVVNSIFAALSSNTGIGAIDTTDMFDKVRAALVKQAIPFAEQINNHDMEHDAGELLTHMLDLLKTEAEHRGEPTNTTFEECLKLIVKSINRCKACNNTSDTNTPDNILKVTLLRDELKDCIEDMFKEEILTNGNRWNCETSGCTGKTTKQVVVEGSPKVLIVQLNRFADPTNKITRKITYTQDLNFNEKTYQLKAVINHLGQTMQTGHYTTTALGSDGKWYTANDSEIAPTEFSVSSDAYILLYEVLS